MKNNRLIAFFLGFICTVVMVLALKELSTIFIPLIFAVLFSIIVSPTIKFMSKYKIPKAVSLTIVVLIVFLVLYLLGLVIYASFASFVQEWPRYQTSLQITLQTTLDGFNLPMDEFQQYFANMDWGKKLEKLSIGSAVSSTVGSFLTFLGYVILVLIFSMFMLSGQFNVGEKLKHAFESKRAMLISDVMTNIQNKVRVYLVTKLMISGLTALIGVLCVIFFGGDFAIVTGVLIFTLNFIPNIGSIIATLFPVLICFVEYGYSWRVPGLALSLVATQMTFGNVVEPLLMGRGLNLSPIIIILSLIFWGWVWGLVGMVLAVPLTSTLVIVCENIESLRPVAVLLSGKGVIAKKL